VVDVDDVDGLEAEACFVNARHDETEVQRRHLKPVKI
jgi:hypothetical protein